MPTNTRSNHLKKCAVAAGKKKSTNGLKKKDILKRAKSSAAVKTGHKAMCISKKKHAVGKQQAKSSKSWIKACQRAKKKLGLKGFHPVKKGTRLYALAKTFHEAAKRGPTVLKTVLSLPARPARPAQPVAARTRARTRRPGATRYNLRRR